MRPQERPRPSRMRAGLLETDYDRVLSFGMRIDTSGTTDMEIITYAWSLPKDSPILRILRKNPNPISQELRKSSPSSKSFETIPKNTAMNFILSSHLWLRTAALCFLLAGTALAQTAFAPPDVQLVDSDGDNSVRYRLDGSGARNVMGNIASWTWTWAGGSAEGEFPEIDFTTAPTPLTITLTVTDQGGQTLQDSFELDVLDVQETFVDLSDPAFAVDHSPLDELRVTLRSDGLLIDPEGPELPKHYLKEDGSWFLQTTPPGGPDMRLVGQSGHLVTGNFKTGASLQFHFLYRILGSNGRYNASWGTSEVSIFSSLPGEPGHALAPLPLGPEYKFEFGGENVVIRRSDTRELQAYSMGDTGLQVDADWYYRTTLTPETPLNPNDSWGDGIAVSTDLIAVTRLGSSGNNSLTIFTNNNIASTWERDATLQANGGIGGFAFTGPVVIDEDGTNIVAGVVDSTGRTREMHIRQENQGWQQTLLELHPKARDGLTQSSMAAGTEWLGGCSPGAHLLYNFYDKNGQVLPTPGIRVLPTPGIYHGAARRISVGQEYSDSSVAYDLNTGKVFVYDNDPPDNRSSEPIIEFIPGISATTTLGTPATVFLDGSSLSTGGGGAYDPDEGDTLTVTWTWAGGTATGLQTTATLDPSVTSITLKVVDRSGIVKIATIPVDIIETVVPPVANC
jgi:hypothetical protein